MSAQPADYERNAYFGVGIAKQFFDGLEVVVRERHDRWTCPAETYTYEVRML